MRKITRRVFLGASAAVGAVALAELTGVKDSFAQRRGAGVVNLYSSRHYNTDKRLYTDFERQTGIRVNLIEGKGDELLERIKSEGKNSPADILMTVNAAILWQAQRDGLFIPVNSRILRERIPPYLRDPANHWFGFSKRARVIMYNKSKVSPSELSTYEDLASPKWKGRIVMRSSTNIYNQSLVANMIVRIGKERTERWVRGLVANFARPPEGNDSAQIEAVAAGIADLTIANTYYLVRYANDPRKREVYDRVGVFFPDQRGAGVHINISGGGVLRHAPNKENAIRFLEYLVSPSAQDYFARGNNEYPVVKGVKLEPVLAQWGTFKEDTTGVAKQGPNLAEAIRIMDRAGWK